VFGYFDIISDGPMGNIGIGGISDISFRVRRKYLFCNFLHVAKNT